MAALEAAGMIVDYGRGGSELKISGLEEDSCKIRNRGGEALADTLSGDHNIRVLDIRQSYIPDNGIAYVCLAIRRTDQISELYLSNVGQHGFEFVLGVVQRSTKLRKLHLTLTDVPTLNSLRQTIEATDYDVADFENKNTEEEEEEEPAEGEEPVEDKNEKFRKVFMDNAYDSDEEDEKAKQKEAEEAARKAKKAGEKAVVEQPKDEAKEAKISPKLTAQLRRLVEIASVKENLIEIEVDGACPADVKYEIQRVVEEHRRAEEKKLDEKESSNVQGAISALKDQMDELNKALGMSTGEKPDKKSGFLDLAELEKASEKMSLDIRTYINRRLFAVLGEALFECQRFKSKGNEAVSTPEGEMAFVSMYIRQHIADEEKNGKAGQRGRFAATGA